MLYVKVCGEVGSADAAAISSAIAGTAKVPSTAIKSSDLRISNSFQVNKNNNKQR